MSEPTKKRRVFWISPEPSVTSKERALSLTSRGYAVHFFNTLDRMTTELEAKRAAVIVISDEGNEAEIENIIISMMTMPEVQAARLVLATTRPSPKICHLAACSNFRDIIPLDLDERTFLNRFAYATANRPLNYVQPAGQIALRNISGLSFPARVNWIRKDCIRLECRLKAPAGASIAINGPLAQALGVPSLTARVLETQRDRLMYRFSDAITAEWQVPTSLRERAKATIEDLRTQSTGPRIRVFIAVQSTDIRSDIMVRFEDPRFELATALQKQSIADDPKFFTPDIVFIEDTLAAAEGASRFRQMLNNISSKATIFVIGTFDALDEFQKEFGQHTLVALPRQSGTLSTNILARYLPIYNRKLQDTDREAVYFAAENPFALAEIHVPARLTRIHPIAVQLALPYPATNFSLARVESPLIHKTLGRSPYLKITATYTDSHPHAAPFPQLVEGYLADCSLAERQVLGSQLVGLIQESLTRFDLNQTFVDLTAASGSMQRMPEFGSVNQRSAADLAKVVAIPFTNAAATTDNLARTLPDIRVLSPVATMLRSVSDNPVPETNPATEVEFEAQSQHQSVFVDRIAKAVATSTSVATDEAPAIAIPGIQDPETVAKQARRAARAAQQRQQLLKNLKALSAFVAVVASSIFVLWLIATYVAPTWNQSGSVYSEQLRRFAPDRAKP